MVAYPDLACGEDTVAIEVLARRQQLTLLDRPDLYVYTFHSGNTVGRTHWAALLDRSTALSWAESQEVLRRTGADAIEMGGQSLRDISRRHGTGLTRRGNAVAIRCRQPTTALPGARADARRWPGAFRAPPAHLRAATRRRY